MSAQCHCGRFMADTHAIVGSHFGPLPGGDAYIADVRGDCSRCGPDQQAHREDWHWSWDAWKWGPEWGTGA